MTTPARDVPVKPAPYHGATALVFDDHPGVAQLLQTRLIQSGIAARATLDRAGFLHEMDTATPDLLFLDLALGATDAVEVLDLLRQRHFTGRIVLVSGTFSGALDHVSRIGLRAGLAVAGALRKPFRARELQELLDRLYEPTFAEPPSTAASAPDVTLRTGLDNGWIEFWYQPKVDLVTGDLVGAEALARLRHPESGVHLPGPLLKGASPADMAELLVRSLDSLLADIGQLERGDRPMSFSINVAGCTLAEPDLLDRLRQHRAGFDPALRIILEVTETDMVEDRVAAETFMTRAVLHGFELSIDDFGHGYATFERLRSMPFTELKLERSMVDGSADERALEHICRAAVRLGHDFGARVVAEGIEREVDLALVRSLGFDMGQGYLFSPAVPAAEFARLPGTFDLRPFYDGNDDILRTAAQSGRRGR